MSEPSRTSTTPEEKLSRQAFGLAILLYLGVALFWMGEVWSRPTEWTLRASGEERALVLIDADQQMVLATVVDAARRFVDPQRSLYDSGACHPLPRSFTLGEHMWGNGLLAALPLALSGEPLLAYNVVLLVLVWFAGLAMFCASWEWTRSVPAALVAGLAFALFRPRLSDPIHPYVNADLWTAAALYFLCRLFRRGDWRSALGLAVTGTLQLAESLYPIIGASVLLGVSGLSLAVRRRDVLLDRLPKLLFCMLVAGGAAWFIFGPYLEAGQRWGILAGRVGLQPTLAGFAPGTRFFPGGILVGLALLGLLDRLRGPRGGPGGDLRIALTVAGALLLWGSVAYIPLPFTDLRLWSPMPYLQTVVPGLSALRAVFGIYAGAYLVLCVLAGYGVLAATERRPRWFGAGVACVAIFALFAESVHPRLARASFGSTLPVRAAELTLPRADREMLRGLGDVTVIDYPPRPGNLVAHAHYLHAAAEHGGATGACYNSFDSPVADDVGRIARTLPDPAAAAALAGLGFDRVLVHLDTLPAGRQRRFSAELERGDWKAAGLTEIARTGNHVAFRLESPIGSRDAWAMVEGVDAEAVVIEGPRSWIPFRFRNKRKGAFRHPAPLQPSSLLLRWFDESDREVASSRVDGLLPVAIGPGREVVRRLELEVGVPPGRYRIELARAGSERRALSRAFVEVR